MQYKKSGIPILLAGLGDLSGLVHAYEKAFPGHGILSAKTAAEGLGKLAAEPDRVLLQPVCLLPGTEYEKLCAEGAGFGHTVLAGKPLLSSEEAIAALAAVLTAEYGQSAVLFVGHGSAHPKGGAVYQRLAGALGDAGFAKAFLGVLEGAPDLASTVMRLRKSGVSALVLSSLTLTRGKHFRRDIFGEQPSSWESRLKSEGFSVSPAPKTLLDFPEVRRMFIESSALALKEGKETLYVQPGM